MFSKFKIQNFNNLFKFNLIKNLNTDSIISNGKPIVKRTLPQLTSINNEYKNHQDNKSNKNHKYDVFKTCSSNFKVQAKVADKEDFVLPNNLPSSKSTKLNNSNKPDLRKSYNFIADAAESAIPSVVKIVVYDKDPYFGRIKVTGGSGFIFSKDKTSSLIMTNAHVIDGYDEVNVELQNGKKLIGRVECVDSFTDLATIKIDDNSLPALEFEPSKDVRLGEFVIALGYPFNLNSSVTSGIISSMQFAGEQIGQNEMKYIQTDCSINIGHSGGPLLALNGKVIGINTLKIAESGFNLAIPSDYAIKFIETAKKLQNKKQAKQNDSKSKKKFVGITMLSLTPEIINELKIKGLLNLNGISYGVLLVKVAENSIAEKVGLKMSDIIIEINGKKALNAQDVYNMIEENTNLNLLIIRAGEKMKFKLRFS